MNPAILGLEVIGAVAIFAAIASLGLRKPSPTQELASRLRMAEVGGSEQIIFAAPRDRIASRAKGYRETWTRVVELLSGRFGAGSEGRAVKLADDLSRADLKLRVGEWSLINVGTILLGVLIGFGLYHNVFFAAIFAAVGWVAPAFYLRWRQRRRTRKFNNQLGDTLTLLSNALKAGYSFPQAMATISRSAEPPIADEFGRATREVQLGVSTDDALKHMVDRVNSEDFDLMVTAVQVQRIVGGNLAEILDTIAHTIRERIRIKGEIRTLTAQARASGYIIAVLPIALAFLLSLISPGYFGPMLHFPGPGPFMLGIGLVMILLGFGIIMRIVKIEV
ncbi:MAG TPA: type II secretion system F family protein [Candidatus Micrarchaeia archaeon]|nr:type II secretion system F family protein [Candidatus Micrarchaeia archaeon]